MSIKIKQYKNTDYWITSSGNVYSIKKLKPQKNSGGYLRVKILNKETKKRKNHFIHRLVAEVFDKDFNDILQVNHLDKK